MNSIKKLCLISFTFFLIGLLTIIYGVDTDVFFFAMSIFTMLIAFIFTFINGFGGNL